MLHTHVRIYSYTSDCMTPLVVPIYVRIYMYDLSTAIVAAVAVEVTCMFGYRVLAMVGGRFSLQLRHL